MVEQAVFIEPSNKHYLEDRLFDTANPKLNRDGSLIPFARLKTALNQIGIPVHTADRLRNGEVLARSNYYWSLGMINGFQEFHGRKDVRLSGFILFEPPLVAPQMYELLPELSRHFEKVFIHNIEGDGYSLIGTNISSLCKLYWPQPYDNVIEPYWSNTERLNKLVTIAGLHNPYFKKPQLYSNRIEAIACLNKFSAVDLYGRGWDKWWSRNAATMSYWNNIRSIMQTYCGPCDSKIDTLSKYKFSLCFENAPMFGYLTEKIFDCFYSGTVPIYLGAKNINSLVPKDAYVDMREFGSNDYEAMWKYVSNITEYEWNNYRESGRDFISSNCKTLYFNSLIDMIVSEISHEI